MPVPEFEDLLAEARAGRQGAYASLVRRYSEPIHRVVCRRMDHRLRSLYDPDDFVQDVWADFFSNCLPQETFSSSAHLIAFLSRMAVNKLSHAHQRHLDAKKRCLSRQVPVLAELLHPGASAQRIVDALDEYRHLVASTCPLTQEILRLLCLGHSGTETPLALGISERTLGRMVARLRPQFASKAAG